MELQVKVDYDIRIFDIAQRSRFLWRAIEAMGWAFTVGELVGAGLPTEISVQLVRFDKPMTDKEVAAEYEKLNVRPLNIWELECLRRQHPNLEFVVGLGWAFFFESGTWVPVIDDCGIRFMEINAATSYGNWEHAVVAK